MSPVRRAVHANRFYPGDPRDCDRTLDELLDGLDPPAALGGIVPHAGWTYSGRTAAHTWKAIAAAAPETVVLFGAVHRPVRHAASVYGAGAWETPLGEIEIDEELARRLIDGDLLIDAPEVHAAEHSLEVQAPFIRKLMPQARIVPIMVRPVSEAVQIGQRCGSAAREAGRKIAFVGSTDLTHYGPAFDFEPEGSGRLGVRWAHEVNDRRMIDLIANLGAEDVLSEASVHYNACGPGAIAATIAAVRELGADRYEELQHTWSAAISGRADPDPLNSVGYEAGIFLS